MMAHTTLIIFDSAYGNTSRVAEAIATVCADHGKTRLLAASDVEPDVLQGVDMLVVGSPTQGGRATPAILEFIEELPDLHGMPVAAFDTRFDRKGHGIALNFLMRAIGYAAPKIGTELTRKHGKLAVPVQGFIVTGKEGPLQPGELDKVTDWARTLWATAKT